MTIIRVDPSLLQGFASTIGGAAGEVSGVGGMAAEAAASAPSYDGQFGPKVWPIGGEAIARVRGAASHLSNLSERLGQKATAFAEVDAAAIDGLAWGYKNWLDQQAQMAARWSKLTGIPAAVIERYLIAGTLGGGTASAGLLFGIVMLPGMFSWTGQTYQGIQRPSWWPGWLWPGGSTRPVAKASAAQQQSSKASTEFTTSPRTYTIPMDAKTQWQSQREFDKTVGHVTGMDNCGPATTTAVFRMLGKTVDYETVKNAVRENQPTGFTDFASSTEKTPALQKLYASLHLTQTPVNDMPALEKQIVIDHHPVIVAVDNRQYDRGGILYGTDSGWRPAGTATNHIVVAHGIEIDPKTGGKVVVISDPLAADGEKGANFRVPWDDFVNAAATSKTGPLREAVAVVPTN